VVSLVTLVDLGPGGWWFEPKDTEMALKALPKPYVTLKDFYTEFHYGLHLGG
jgi:hypothetical protein